MTEARHRTRGAGVHDAFLVDAGYIESATRSAPPLHSCSACAIELDTRHQGGRRSTRCVDCGGTGRPMYPKLAAPVTIGGLTYDRATPALVRAVTLARRRHLYAERGT
jgi:hypothetical protein